LELLRRTPFCGTTETNYLSSCLIPVRLPVTANSGKLKQCSGKGLGPESH
jgi:hypothetical protein